MAIMIACSPSTGSSLLRRILNRHPEVFCGSETSLLAKACLYTNWQSCKARIRTDSRVKLADSAWHHFRGLILDEEYDISDDELNTMISDSKSFKIFIDSLFSLILSSNSKSYWVEKTPSNSFTAKLFLDYFTDAKLIHIVRDPYDAIGSLVNRGMDVYNACSVYLLNCSHVLELKDHPRHHLVRYEHLVNEPESCLQQLFSFLDIPYTNSVLDVEAGQIGMNKMEGWTHEETGRIGKKGLSRFDRLDPDLRKQIIQSCKSLRSNLDTSCKCIQDICDVLSYEFRSVDKDVNNLRLLKRLRTKDILKRVRRLSYFNIHNYPISIHA